MRGLVSYGVYLPGHRLDRSTIAAVAGTGGGKGTRSVAGFDEDTTTMAVDAARTALGALQTDRRDLGITNLAFATVAPAYFDKTNATAIHAALRLDSSVLAYDALGSVRSGLATLRLALESSHGAALLLASDIRTGLPGSVDEASGGDGAVALLVSDDRGPAPVLAEYLGGASVSTELLDRWRVPGSPTSQVWEERFGEVAYVPLGVEAWKAALGASGLDSSDVHHVAIASLHARAAKSLVRALGVEKEKVVDDLSATVGNTGVAHAGLLLASVLERAEPNETVALVSMGDGADVLLFKATDALAEFGPARPVAAQAAPAAGHEVPYGKFLAWRGMLRPEPPRRPEPARPSAPAAARHREWKFGLVPDNAPGSLAERTGTVATFTIDRLAYSPSPPVVFAVVDFPDGERLPLELTDVNADELTIGTEVEMTFRRLFSADGIQNYFWKARPRTSGGS